MATPMARLAMGSRPATTPRRPTHGGVQPALTDHAMSELEHAEHVEALQKAHAIALEKKDAHHAFEREKAKVLVLHAETQAAMKSRKVELAAKHAQDDLLAEHERELARMRATLEREYERKEADCKAKLAVETAALKNCMLELQEKNQEVQALRATLNAEKEQHALELAREQRKAAAAAEQLRQDKEAAIALAKEESERCMQEQSEAAQDKLATVKQQADTLRREAEMQAHEAEERVVLKLREWMETGVPEYGLLSFGQVQELQEVIRLLKTERDELAKHLESERAVLQRAKEEYARTLVEMQQQQAAAAAGAAATPVVRRRKKSSASKKPSRGSISSTFR